MKDEPIHLHPTNYPNQLNDPVNHPSHYTKHPSGVECIDIVEHMNFNLGNAIKYIWRAGEKGNQIEDLQKARWYLSREIERLDRGAPNQHWPMDRETERPGGNHFPRNV